MEQVEARGDWYIFDPLDVEKIMGFRLEDYYDEKQGEGSFRKKYFQCVEDAALPKTKIPAIQIMVRIMKSQLETGTPFMFYRDEVNRKNPNKHTGMIYSSNLCTEIMQNMSPTIQYKETIDGDTIITYKKAGDMVVCNFSSINLGKAVPDNVLERLIPIQVRLLDNVIDLNTIEVKQAVITKKNTGQLGSVRSVGIIYWLLKEFIGNRMKLSNSLMNYMKKLLS
jgi:ribonucleoside-diphosphate reductase alpha chain